MKICMMVYNPFTNDARVKREAKALIAEDFEVFIIAIKDAKNKKLSTYEINDGIKVLRITKYLKHRLLMYIIIASLLVLVSILNIYLSIILFSIFVFFRKYLCKLISVFKVIILMIYNGIKDDYNLYHAHDLNTLLQVVICAKIKKVKCIYDSHEVQTSRNGYNKILAKIIESILIKFIDEMIMTTNTRGEYTYKLYKIRPVIIHNYSEYLDYEKVEAFNLYELFNIEKKNKILLYQGGIQKGRGLSNLIKAIKYINNCHLLIIGQSYKGEKERLLDLIYDLNLECKVTFVDKIRLEELPKYTKGAYIGFQLLQNTNYNHYSALSNKLFEYMMMHIPIVSCNLIEIKKVIEDNKIGIVVDSNNVLEIKEAIEKILNDQKFHLSLVNNCKRAKLIYNWNNEKIKLISLYKEILNII